jgi:hypothetical protein
MVGGVVHGTGALTVIGCASMWVFALARAVHVGAAATRLSFLAAAAAAAEVSLHLAWTGADLART